MLIKKRDMRTRLNLIYGYSYLYSRIRNKAGLCYFCWSLVNFANYGFAWDIKIKTRPDPQSQSYVSAAVWMWAQQERTQKE